MNFTSDIDKKDSSELSNIQCGLLQETISCISKNSPFYRQKLKRLPTIHSIEDIRYLPITTKEDLQQDNWAFLCVKKSELSEIVATTGTTGAHVFIGLTKKDLRRLAENEKRCFSYAGATHEDTFLLAVTMDNLFIAGMAYYSGLQQLGAAAVRIGPQNPKKQIDIIQTLNPTGIVAIPSFIVSIWKEAEKNNIRLEKSSLKKVMLIGESIRNPDFSSNMLGKMVERLSVAECFSTYGVTEAQAAFCECPYHTGLHSHPDLIYPEILDDEGNAVSDGEAGELVITTFGIEGMPLLRYRTGDITFRIAGKCACGRTSLRLGPVIGRKSQKLKLKGATVYPKTIENALLEIEGVENYVVEAYTGDDCADHVIVKIGSNKSQKSKLGSQKLKEAVCENIKAKARVTPKVEIMLPQEVEKILYEGGRRKPMTFIDRRQKAL